LDWTRSKKKPTPRRRGTKRKRTQRGWGVNIQNGWLKPVLNFIGLAISTWDPGLNLPNDSSVEIPASIDWSKIAKQHDIDYSHAKNLQDKWKADTKMIKAIDRLPGKKNMTERVVNRIMQAKKRLKL